MVIHVLFVIKCTNQILDKKIHKIHKNDIPRVDSINPKQNPCQVYHICLKSYKSAAELVSHLVMASLRSHGLHL